jgi:hypothetical protein
LQIVVPGRRARETRRVKTGRFGVQGAGLAAWSAATLFYAAFGGGLLESAFWFYALNAFAAAAVVTFAFQAVARLTHTPRRRRLFRR